MRVAVRGKGINLNVDELLSLDQASRELQREPRGVVGLQLALAQLTKAQRDQLITSQAISRCWGCHAGMSTSSARIFMHILEYSVTLSARPAIAVEHFPLF